MREGGRLKKRERRGSETDVRKLYSTMNLNSLWSVKLSRKSKSFLQGKLNIYTAKFALKGNFLLLLVSWIFWSKIEDPESTTLFLCVVKLKPKLWLSKYTAVYTVAYQQPKSIWYLILVLFLYNWSRI